MYCKAPGSESLQLYVFSTYSARQSAGSMVSSGQDVEDFLSSMPQAGENELCYKFSASTLELCIVSRAIDAADVFWRLHLHIRVTLFAPYSMCPFLKRREFLAAPLRKYFTFVTCFF